VLAARRERKLVPGVCRHCQPRYCATLSRKRENKTPCFKSPLRNPEEGDRKDG